MTLTRLEAAPYVEAILGAVPDDMGPVMAGQLRLEAPLITRFDVVLIGSATPPDFTDPLKVEWDPPSRGISVGRGYIKLTNELPVTLWMCSGKALGAVMLHATGPAEFTTALKRKAQRKGFILHQDGLFFNIGSERLDNGSEQSIFRMLDVPWMEPADRNAFSKIDYRDQAVIERVVPASKGSKTYLVRILGDKAHCPCPGFQHRHTCRHLIQVRQELGLSTPLRTDVLGP